MKHTVKSKTSGKALLVNPAKLIRAVRKWRHSYLGDEKLCAAVDEYEAKLRKGGRKP